MRRPPDSCIPRQLRKLSLISFQVGMVLMVLSQFCTLIVCRLMSMTSPSAFWLGISIQSPTRNMSLLDSCRLATSDSRVSLNTSISTAVIAPKPVSRTSGDLPINAAMMSTPAMM